MAVALLGVAAAGGAATCTDPDPSPVVVIDDCDTGVSNHVLDDGCSINDRIALCSQGAANHGEFVSCVGHLASDLRDQGLITGSQRGAIVSCAARADLPPGEETVVTIISPADGSTVPDRLVEVAGTVQPASAADTVDLLGFSAPVSSTGAFAITGFPLVDGENTLMVEALESGTTIGWAEVTVFYFLPSEAAVSVTPEQGGSATVTDPDSPVFGAGIDIPDGAATRSFRALVVSDPEHVPNLPFGELPVGPPVAFGPEAESFASEITLTLPFDPGALPAGTTSADVVIRALGDAGWVILPATGVTADRATVSLDRLAYSQFVVVVEAPLAPGQLLVTTRPADATLYLDRVDTGARSPVILDGVPAGTHELKAYVPGFNEVFHTVSVPASGARIALDLGVPVEPIPAVILDPDLQDGMEVNASFIDVTADVAYAGAPLTSGLAVLSVNGDDGFEPIDPDGKVRGAVALFPGDNLLQVRVTGPNGSTGTSATINIIRTTALGLAQASDAASQDITVRLSWNTDTTDLDTHVFDPAGNHAWYGNLGGIPGGRRARPHDPRPGPPAQPGEATCHRDRRRRGPRPDAQPGHCQRAHRIRGRRRREHHREPDLARAHAQDPVLPAVGVHQPGSRGGHRAVPSPEARNHIRAGESAVRGQHRGSRRTRPSSQRRSRASSMRARQLRRGAARTPSRRGLRQGRAGRAGCRPGDRPQDRTRCRS
jgi:hypothetical protein